MRVRHRQLATVEFARCHGVRRTSQVLPVAYYALQEHVAAAGGTEDGTEGVSPAAKIVSPATLPSDKRPTFVELPATSAATGMISGDDYSDGNRFWFRLHEKGGRYHEVPVHHRAQAYLDEYLREAGIMFLASNPLFRTIDRYRRLTDRRLHRREVLAMIKKYAKRAKLPYSTCCHTFRATGITSYLLGGGTLERAQQIAAHADASTTKLYDRRDDAVTWEEVERIGI